MIIIAVQ